MFHTKYEQMNDFLIQKMRLKLGNNLETYKKHRLAEFHIIT